MPTRLYYIRENTIMESFIGKLPHTKLFLISKSEITQRFQKLKNYNLHLERYRRILNSHDFSTGGAL